MQTFLIFVFVISAASSSPANVPAKRRMIWRSAVSHTGETTVDVASIESGMLRYPPHSGPHSVNPEHGIGRGRAKQNRQSSRDALVRTELAAMLASSGNDRLGVELSRRLKEETSGLSASKDATVKFWGSRHRGKNEKGRTEPAPAPAGRSTPLPEGAAYGTVYAVYTFGAVGANNFSDGTKPNGCFRGLRVWNEDHLFGTTTDDFAPSFSWWPHAKLSTLALRKDNPVYTSCDQAGDRVEKLPNTWLPNAILHANTEYARRMDAIANGAVNSGGAPQDVVDEARVHSHLASAAYRPTCQEARDEVASGAPTWRLVHHQTHMDAVGDRDIVAIYQNETFDCALVFEGSDHALELITSNTDNRGKKYCGKRSMRGYVDELRGIVQTVWTTSFKEKLSHCSSVAVTGHSLGGAVAEVFAGCANSENYDDRDFQEQSWIVGVPQQLPSFDCTA